MPYRRRRNQVLHKKGGKWRVKQTCSSEAAAKAAIRLLYGIEGGMKPRRGGGKNPPDPRNSYDEVNEFMRRTAKTGKK